MRFIPRHILFLLVLTGFLPDCRTLPSAGPTYERDYADEIRLSAEKEREVVALAAQAGVTEIGKIETFFVEPGHLPSILVKEAETISGRRVSYRTIKMVWKPKKPEELSATEEPKAIGPIVADPPRTVELTILKAGGREYRVRLDDSVTPTEGESILGCFLGEKIRFIRKPTVYEDYLRVSDFSNPSSIRFDKTRGLHVITFDSEESYRSSAYYGTKEGDVFVAHKVVTRQA